MKDPTKVYFFDAKGDQNNMVFGALYRLDIPSYFKSRKALGKNYDDDEFKLTFYYRIRQGFRA